MAKTTIHLERSSIEVEMTVGPGRTIERFDSVRYLGTGKKVDLARKGVHSKVFNAVALNLETGKVSFEEGEDPNDVFISEDGLAEFDEQNG